MYRNVATLDSGIQDEDKVHPRMAEHTPGYPPSPGMPCRILKDLPREFEVDELDSSDESENEPGDAFVNK
jgi:hypothetical protein